ncbi:MAG TPA: winged helix DNA-binding domain-containing protein [Solirubrobacteraceae bacterium]
MRTLTRRDLNRAVLARQLLLERTDLPLPAALERMAGLQAQYAPSMYVGLWSRLEGFERAALDEALERRSVVLGTLMRTTIHLVAREDYWPFALAVRADRRAWWLKVVRDAPSPQAMAGAARAVRRALAGGTLSRRELEALVGRERFAGVGLWIELVRAPPSGTWERRRADLFAAAEDWLGPPALGVAAAEEHLVHRYLGAFGPAPEADVARWAGLPPASLRGALARLQLRRFRGERGEELLDLPGAPLPDPETPAPPRLLGTFDASLLAVHARRTGFLPEAHRPRFFDTKRPQSLPPFTVDGVVRGAWRHERGKVELEPFERIDAAAMRALREEADRLADLHAMRSQR